MAEDEIIKKHTKAAFKVLKAHHTSWQHKLKEILLEIVVIVFAVSISIWFHNWSERRQDHQQEKEFLTSLKKDLQDDKNEMISDRAGFATVLQGVNYFRKVGEGLPLSNDSLKKYSGHFLGALKLIRESAGTRR